MKRRVDFENPGDSSEQASSAGRQSVINGRNPPDAQRACRHPVLPRRQRVPLWLCLVLAINTLVVIRSVPAGGLESKAGTATSADGLAIYYEVTGSGSPTIVLIHGWCCDQTFWAPQRDYFAQRHQVVTLDLAGHGRSAGDRPNWTMKAFGEDVAAVVRHLKAQRVILVGHSMGGPVILEAAALLQPELAGLVAIDAFHDPDESYTFEQMTSFHVLFGGDFPTAMKRALHHGEDFFRNGTDQALIDRITATMTAAPPKMGHGAFMGMLDFANTRQRPLMSATQVPFFCINTKREPEKVAAGKKYAPQFDVVAMPESGHFLMMERPEEFNELLSVQLRLRGLVE